MVSPSSKLKMFTGSVCVLLTSVSLKLIKIKLIYAATSSWEKNKTAGERQLTPTDFIFLFMIRVDPRPIVFYFLFFLFYPSWFDPDWRSEFSLRSKRFRLVSEQKTTEERDFPFWPRSLTLVPRSLLLNRTETLATQASPSWSGPTFVPA